MTDEECFQVSFTLAKMLCWFEKKECGRVKAYKSGEIRKILWCNK